MTALPLALLHLRFFGGLIVAAQELIHGVMCTCFDCVTRPGPPCRRARLCIGVEGHAGRCTGGWTIAYAAGVEAKKMLRAAVSAR